MDTHKTRPTRGSHIEVTEKFIFCRCSEDFVCLSMALVGTVKLLFCLVLWLSHILSTSQGSLLLLFSFSISSYMVPYIYIFILVFDLCVCVLSITFHFKISRPKDGNQMSFYVLSYLHLDGLFPIFFAFDWLTFLSFP